MRMRADSDLCDLDCGEMDEIGSSRLFCGPLMSRYLKATRSGRSTPSSMENRTRESGKATVSRRLRCSPQVAILVLVLNFTVQAATQKLDSIPIPGTKAFPESITSRSDGTLYVGRLGDGGIVRIKPHTHENAIFVRPGTLGSRSILGVFADEASNTLWACSNDLSALGAPAKGSDTGSALKAFDLRTGNGKRSVSLPGTHAFCNDIDVDAKGSIYVTDSANPTILKLFPRATTFEVFAQDSVFSAPQNGGAGLDGIAFGSDGNLYVTTYTAGELLRVEVKDGTAGRVTKLSGNRHLQFPDALRKLGDNSFLLVEGAGTLDRVVVKDNGFAVTPIYGNFSTPTSVALIGTTAWVTEGNTTYFFDISKKNVTPPLPFRIYAVSLRKENTK
jgi:sugar lactone lactonase YvrE